MEFRKRSQAYWDKRAAEQLTLVEKEALPFLKLIDRVYLDARRMNVEAARKLYEAYYSKQGWDTQALKSLAPQGDIRRFQEAVRAAGLVSELPDGYGFRLNRLELLEAQMWLESHKAAKAHTALQTAAHKQTIDTAYNYAMYNLAKGTGVAPAFSQLNTRTINRILGAKFHGKNYSQRVWNNSNLLARGLKKDLAQAVATGQSPSRTIKQIKDRYNVTRYQASRLVRTETNHFNTLATTESYQSAGLEEFIYVATLDGRTSSICAELDGKRFKLTDTEHMPPQHPNCVLPETVVLAPEAEAMTKSQYSGDIFELVTRHGRRLRLTANHIVLTSRGWVRAKNIVEGDKVVDYKLWDETTRRSPADNNSVASVEKVFASLAESSGVSTGVVTATTEHLKGDVVENSEINIVFTNGLLRGIADAPFVHLLSDVPFVDTINKGKGTLSGLSSLNKLLIGTALASDGILSSLSVLSLLFRGSTTSEDLISFFTPSQYDARLSESMSNDGRSNAFLCGDRTDAIARLIEGDKFVDVERDKLASVDAVSIEQPDDGRPLSAIPAHDVSDGLSSFVEFDDVISVRREFYSGHVYDLSTMSSLYIANGIITSNCRSTQIAYLGDEYAYDERIMRDESGENRYISNMSYSQWRDLYL